ncbi:MAG: hypothetical protein ABIP94_19725, partial [Planctomycetota bacterium]
GYLLSIPGVDDDFVLFADGQFEIRGNGTARLSAYAQRPSALDREFYVVLEFSGRVAPTDPGYPPNGSPITTLLPSAYAPSGPVDPASFVYYTAVTGTLTGLRSYGGARLHATNLGPAQIGDGASNKNVGPGLALDLDLTVAQQPVFGTLTPTGPAQLRATLSPSLTHCATHVDPHPLVSSSTVREGLALPGVGTDYIFVPSAQWVEDVDGTATLRGTVRRQSDYTDEWHCTVSLDGRVDPGDSAYPPGNGAVLELLPTAYASLGGPADQGDWRYYTTAVGMLEGRGINTGGLISLQTSGLFQIGLGAGQGNLFFGLSGGLAPVITQQPTGRTLMLTGDVSVHCNLATSCILPSPQVLTGIAQSIPSVTQQKLVYTGIDLGWVEQIAIGPHIIGRGDPRRWYEGNLRVVDHTTIEVSIPQGLAVAQYPAVLLNQTTLSNPLTVDVQAPATPTLRTENDRLAGETQHWVAHQGNVVGFAFCFVLLSLSDLPSMAPGLVNLNIGNQFADIILLDVTIHDAVTGVAVVSLPSIPPSFAGLRLHAQAALMGQTFFPLIPSDTWFTDYL